MSLFCEWDGDGAEWYYECESEDFVVLDTKRGRRCCSCKKPVRPGEEVVKFRRYRPPSDRCNHIEESIYGDEVPMADWYMCEECGGLYMAITELKLCHTLGGDIRAEIKEYAADVKAGIK